MTGWADATLPLAKLCVLQGHVVICLVFRTYSQPGNRGFLAKQSMYFELLNFVFQSMSEKSNNTKLKGK